MRYLLGLVLTLSPFLAGGLALKALADALTRQDKPVVSKSLKGDDEIRANVRELQLQQERLISRFTGCQEVIRKGQEDFDKINAQIQTEVAKAFARAKLSQEDYTLDLQSFTFSKKAPAAQEKKP